MKSTTKTAWMAALAVLSLVPMGYASMIGIGREGDYAIEIFAERSDVVRSAGGAKVTLPREAERLFRAADIQTGDGVWSGTGDGAGEGDASVERLTPGWWSCELKLKEPVRPAPQPVERFHLLRWPDLGGRFASRLDGLAQTNAAAWRAGLEDVLARARTVFGGQSMVVGFPGTKYAAEFANVRRAFDRCALKGQMRGFSAGRDLAAAYRSLFGGEWPTTLQAVFLSGDERPIEIRGVADADGQALPDVFESPLPVRLEGNTSAEGVFPTNAILRIAYAAAEDGEGAAPEGLAIPWSTAASGGHAVWFVLQVPDAGEGGRLVLTTNLLENAASVAVEVKISVGDIERKATLPAWGSVLLCLVVRPGTPIHLNGEAAPSDPYARDWTVSGRSVSGSHVRFDAVRKAQPGLVLNNPEMMPVDVTVTPVGGGWRSATKLTLQAGETGIGMPVPAHKQLAVVYRFRSSFHKAGHTDIPPLFHGDKTNLVLRAELKGDPEVVVQNTGSVAVHLAGMSTPAGGVDILPGKTANVTVPAGRRAVLTGTAAHADYQCDPISLAAMDPGATVSAKLRLSLKPAPQIVLRNAGGTMDAVATPMSGAGRPIGRPFTIKRGASTRPMPLPSGSNAYYRLTYGNGLFTAPGRLGIPAVPRGEIRVLDIPSPNGGVRPQTSSKLSAAPLAASSFPAPADSPAPVPSPSPVPRQAVSPAPVEPESPAFPATAPVRLGP